jgi:hypothetical protein
MTDAPFFDPWPEPEPDEGSQQLDVDLPWMRPVHVAGVVVPVAADVHRGDDVVVQVTHVVAYRRGLEVHVGTWLRPGVRRDLTSAEDVWREQEPRVGVRLADGTRLGHRPPHAPTSPELEARSSFTQAGGEGGGLRFSSAWWLHPFPAGDELRVVVEWEHQGVPESSVALDLGALRTAAAGEEVLWDPPPPLGEGDSFGWFAYAPMSGDSYQSSRAFHVDEPD